MWFSPAKLNLGLKITGRRSNGYHELESLFWPIRFGDEISFKFSKEASVLCSWAEDSPFKTPPLLQNEKNLVGKLTLGGLGWKPTQNLTIQIKKRIPIGSGLGGVSSNAGVALDYLSQNSLISPEVAEQLAHQLGADVPFFLKPVPSWVTGIGEIRRPLHLKTGTKEGFYFLLLLFPFATCTSDLFQKYRELNVPFSPSVPMDTEKLWDFNALSLFLKSARNDLEGLVASQSPDISRGLEILRLTTPLYSGLSGTGSTCFGVYATSEERLAAAKEIQKTCRESFCRTVFAETY